MSGANRLTQTFIYLCFLSIQEPMQGVLGGKVERRDGKKRQRLRSILAGPSFRRKKGMSPSLTQVFLLELNFCFQTWKQKSVEARAELVRYAFAYQHLIVLTPLLLNRSRTLTKKLNDPNPVSSSFVRHIYSNFMAMQTVSDSLFRATTPQPQTICMHDHAHTTTPYATSMHARAHIL